MDVDNIPPYARMLVRVLRSYLIRVFPSLCKLNLVYSRTRLYKEEPTRDIGETKSLFRLARSV